MSMKSKLNLFCLLFAAAFASACVPDKEVVDCTAFPDSPVCIQNSKDPTPAKIYVDPPFGLSFTCVLLGCEETLTLEIQNRGGGSVALSEVELTNNDESVPLDYSVVLSTNKELGQDEEERLATPQNPLQATPDSPVYIHITYTPSDGLDDLATLRLKWFDGREEFEDAEIQTVELSVTARILQSALARIETSELNFGYTPRNTPVTKMIRLTNISTSDTILSVLDATLQGPSSASFQVGLGWTPYVNPGETIEIPVTFSPTEEDIAFGAIELITNDAIGSYVIPLKGTGLEQPRVMVTNPADAVLDFATVRAGETSTQNVTLMNVGGSPAIVSISVESPDSEFTTDLPEGPLLIPSMESVSFEVQVMPTTGGDLNGQLVITPTGDDAAPLTLGLQVFCSAPSILVTEALILPPIVETWTSETSYLEISNSGVGDLYIEQIQFEVGSSSQISLAQPVSLPVYLAPDDAPLQIPFVLSGTNLGAQDAVLLVSHNGIGNSVSRVLISGRVMTCDEGCPTSNGVPNCLSGVCQIGSCNSGWHDQNDAAGDGCECSEDRNGFDIGSVCSSGADLGNLGDCGSDYPSEAIRSGTLHTDTDIDLYFVRTEDAGGACDFFGDSARASVELVSGPEGLALCASIRDEDTGCGGYTTYFDENVCGQSSYSKDGSWGGNNNQELTAWVMWRPDAAPSCGTYTLKFRGED